MVWDQYRRVDAGELSVENLDMDITVENPEDSEHSFDISIWNLKEDSWKKVSEGDYCRVILGWDDGEVENVIHGIIEKKKSERDGRDMKFTLKGTDATDHMMKRRFSKTYDEELTPDEVFVDIVGTVGLTAGTVDNTPDTLDKDFPISDDKPVRHWLDELVKEAELQTRTAWQWFAEAGSVYFVEQDGEKPEAVKLSYDNTLLSLNEADSEADGVEGLKFEAMMEPKIRKDGAVAVDTEEHQGAYSVVEYTFTSDTTTGDHVVEGRLSPLNVGYEPEVEGYHRGKI